MEKPIITGTEAHEYQVWQVPKFSGDNPSFATAEKEQRDNAAGKLSDGEIIEEVELDAVEQETSVISVDELERITQEAYDEGYQKGHEEGREAGFAEGKTEGIEQGREQAYAETKEQIELSISNLESAINDLVQPISDQHSRIEQSLLIIIQRLTKAIVGRELLIDSSHIIDIVRRSIAALPIGEDNISISLNTKDLEFFRQKASSDLLDRCSLTEDENMTPGGCRVISKDSLVDNTVENRIDKVLHEFSQGELTDHTIGMTNEPGLDDVADQVTENTKEMFEENVDNDGVSESDIISKDSNE